ncbi:MAG: glycosyl hydrolase 108 family protein, partial [Pseudomonadota bacterium]
MTTAKTDIATLIDAVIGREGGYSNHPADRGGPTRWGVT